MDGYIILDWSDFKSYLGTSLVPFKQVSKNNTYYLYVSDGALKAMCTIPKDGGSDQTDYESSYQSRANRRFNYYSAPVNIRQSAGTSANATVWAMRNAAASTRTVVIESINLNVSFDSGTPLTRLLQRYSITGFNTATPTGGSSITVSALDNTNPSTQVTDARFVDTGLTTTSVVFAAPFAIIGCPATDATVSNFTYSKPEILLAPGEGLCIRLTVAAVAGQGLTGNIVWSER